MTTDDDTPLTPTQAWQRAHPELAALDMALAEFAATQEGMRRLFRAVLAAKYPDHPWLTTLPEPSQQARDFLVARQGDPQFWRLLAALRDDEASEKGDTDGE